MALFARLRDALAAQRPGAGPTASAPPAQQPQPPRLQELPSQAQQPQPRQPQEQQPTEHPLIDVRDLIERFTVSELNEAAEAYWQRVQHNPLIAAKPFNGGVVEHMLPQIGFLIQGLRLLPDMTVLDFGAGTCFASRVLNQMGMRVISLDVSKTALRIGRELDARWPPVGDVPEHIFCEFDGVTIDLPSESVDRIFCLDAFHHVSDQRATLREMARVLKHGGIAGFCEPGPHHSQSPESQFEMRNSKVIENDIVLIDIFAHARAHGFTELKVGVATIHPPLVQLADLDGYFDSPAAFATAVRDRTMNFPIFFLYKGTPQIADSRDAVDLRAQIHASGTRFSGLEGHPLRFTVDVINSSPKTWLPSGPKRGSVNVGGMLETTGRGIHLGQAREYRFHLSDHEVPAGGIVADIPVELAPLPAGEYVLQLDIVSEHVCWFGSQSDSPIRIQIRVAPPKS